MNIKIELGEQDLKNLILRHLSDTIDAKLTQADVIIEVKSKQNYKSEWEIAAFRARVERNTIE